MLNMGTQIADSQSGTHEEYHNVIMLMIGWQSPFCFFLWYQGIMCCVIYVLQSFQDHHIRLLHHLVSLTTLQQSQANHMFG